ncbi:hypothetical protein EJB05_23034, partial [Eragrostis curvula]
RNSWRRRLELGQAAADGERASPCAVFASPSATPPPLVVPARDLPVFPARDPPVLLLQIALSAAPKLQGMDSEEPVDFDWSLNGLDMEMVGSDVAGRDEP